MESQRSRTSSAGRGAGRPAPGLAWILTAHLDGGRPWRIVDQNHLAPSEDMYTGCWFDYLVTAIINYYRRSWGASALLDEHGYTSSYKAEGTHPEAAQSASSWTPTSGTTLSPRFARRCARQSPTTTWRRIRTRTSGG